MACEAEARSGGEQTSLRVVLRPGRSWLGEEFGDLVVPAPCCPCERRGPFRIVGQAASARRARAGTSPSRAVRTWPPRRAASNGGARRARSDRRQLRAASSPSPRRPCAPPRGAARCAASCSAPAGQSSPVCPFVGCGAVRKEQLLHALVGPPFLRPPTARHPSFRPADSERRRARAGASRSRSGR